MKVGRWFLAGLAFGIIAQVIGGIIYGAIFPHWYDCSKEFFRPMDHPGFMIGLPLLNSGQGLLLALVFPVLYPGIPGKSHIVKGAIFGLLIWLISTLPGLISQVCTTVLRFPLPCLIYTLVSMVLGCLTIAAILGKKE